MNHQLSCYPSLSLGIKQFGGGAEHVLTWADLRYCGLPMVQYWKETGAGKVNDLFFRTIGAQFPERIVVDTNAL